MLVAHNEKRAQIPHEFSTDQSVYLEAGHEKHVNHALTITIMKEICHWENDMFIGLIWGVRWLPHIKCNFLGLGSFWGLDQMCNFAKQCSRAMYGKEFSVSIWFDRNHPRLREPFCAITCCPIKIVVSYVEKQSRMLGLNVHVAEPHWF